MATGMAVHHAFNVWVIFLVIYALLFMLKEHIVDFVDNPLFFTKPTQSHTDQQPDATLQNDCKETTNAERIQKICSERGWNTHVSMETFGFMRSNDKHSVLCCPICLVGSNTFGALL